MKNLVILMFALVSSFHFCFLSAQVRSSYQSRLREAVSIYCDTALTSDLRIVKRPYRFSDNLFYGINLGGNLVLSPKSESKNNFSMVGPSASVYLGKYITPWISASLNLDYSMQQEYLSVPADTTFSFHTLALSLEGQLCLNRLFSRYHANERFLFYALAGFGIQSSFAFDEIFDTRMQVAPMGKVGGVCEWRITEGTSLALKGSWNTSIGKSVCGVSDGHNHRGLELSLGIIRRLPNHYASRSFQNCRGNEIYYFDALEERLLKDHERQLKRYHKGKAEAPAMFAEQDSILIFPYGYPYLTPRQEAKLDIVAQHLASNPASKVIFDIYPIVNDDPKMTPAQAVQRCEVTIRQYLLRECENVQDQQLRFIKHSDMKSPIDDQSIWVHGAIIHYE